MKKFKTNNSGFTLLETLISIFIFSLLLGVIIYFGMDIVGFNSFITQNELQMTLTVLVTELRSMGPSSMGSFPIELAAPNALTFYSDTDQDGLFERIRYYFNDNILMKGTTKPSGSPLTYNPTNEKTTEAVHYVTSNPASTFSYYTKKSIVSDPPMPSPINPYLIRSIKASLMTDQDINVEPGSVMFSVFATIRNFRMSQ